MKYCAKCKKIYTKSEPAACPFCGRELIDDPSSFSPVDIVTAHGFELERIAAALKDADIPYSTREVRRDMGIQILNSAPPENCIVTVSLEHYQQAIRRSQKRAGKFSHKRRIQQSGTNYHVHHSCRDNHSRRRCHRKADKPIFLSVSGGKLPPPQFLVQR